MRLSLVKSKNTVQFYVIQSYRNKNGKNTSKIFEKLGNLEQVTKRANGQDPFEWAKEYIHKLNIKEKNNELEIILKKSTSKLIPKNCQTFFNGGYLFLEKIFYELGLNDICNEISSKYKFAYDLNNILSRLIYSRIIYPSSKLATFELSKKYIEQPNFELHDIYRALEVVSKETDFIQSELYKNSLKISKRNTNILYYDCTNYFFEIEQESGLRQYGPSKEHRPNPITQMGLFMDGDGIPLAFNITAGNTNEQVTLKPLEEKILEDFKLSRFIVCTDAGLASNANRKFNDKDERAFITTQSIKKLKKHLMDWALSPDEWSLSGDNKKYNINDIEKDDTTIELYKDRIFFKERWIKENGLEQKLIVTYSLKYRNYQRQIRNSQIERAKVAIANKSFKLDKSNQNDFKRFIKKINVTEDGEIAEKKVLTLNTDTIQKEEKFDGFYGVCTNLEDSAEEIIKVNQRRWEIEESFRIMKSEFKARPVYLSRDDRIIAHFTTCFLSLVLLRFLEKRLNEKYTTSQIIDTLKNMNFTESIGNGYIPTYTRTDLTDNLHEIFEFRTDYEILSNKNLKNILKNIK
jgi:transposase DDE domain